MNSSSYNNAGVSLRDEVQVPGVFDQHVNILPALPVASLDHPHHHQHIVSRHPIAHGHNHHIHNYDHTTSISPGAINIRIEPDIPFDGPTNRSHGHTSATKSINNNSSNNNTTNSAATATDGKSNTNIGTSSKKKRDGPNLRKAPGAPKRFKSSYIMFFMAKQKEIKEELGDGASVGEISKRSSEKWRKLSQEERAIWDAKAEEDKERYNREKEKYTGPWQIPWKRAKKNPKAPKRPMSAFLFFSQERRRSIKEAHPEMRNTEISRVLGGMWKKASPEERAPHIEREATEREKYKIEIAKWRKEEEIRSRMAADRAEAKWEAKKAREENNDCNSNLNHKSPPVSHRASPLPLSHQPVPSSPIPVQSYYPQGSYGDYYPVQPYAGLPQYNSYNPYPPAPPQSHQPHVQNQAYYRSPYPPAPPHSDFHPSSRHPQDYPPAPPIGRSDSTEESLMHHNRSHNTLSPVGIPPQYGSFTHFPPSAIPHHHGYGNVDQRPSSGSNPNPNNYPEDYTPPS